MPNHVTNEIQAVASVIDSLKGENGEVDFNSVVPMPEILKGESSSPHLIDWARIAIGDITLRSLRSPLPGNPADHFKAGDYGKAASFLERSNIIRMLEEGPYPKDFSDEEFDKFIRYQQALKEHGHADWYSWSNAAWGTKWNAYEIKRKSPTVVRFQTAWSCPMPVVAALSEKFPAERIRVRWADEDTGFNAGDITLLNGELVAGGKAENKSKEAYALSLDLRWDGELPSHYRMNADGTLEYVEYVEEED